MGWCDLADSFLLLPEHCCFAGKGISSISCSASNLFLKSSKSGCCSLEDCVGRLSSLFKKIGEFGCFQHLQFQWKSEPDPESWKNHQVKIPQLNLHVWFSLSLKTDHTGYFRHSTGNKVPIELVNTLSFLIFDFVFTKWLALKSNLQCFINLVYDFIEWLFIAYFCS